MKPLGKLFAILMMVTLTLMACRRTHGQSWGNNMETTDYESGGAWSSRTTVRPDRNPFDPIRQSKMPNKVRDHSSEVNFGRTYNWGNSTVGGVSAYKRWNYTTGKPEVVSHAYASTNWYREKAKQVRVPTYDEQAGGRDAKGQTHIQGSTVSAYVPLKPLLTPPPINGTAKK